MSAFLEHNAMLQALVENPEDPGVYDQFMDWAEEQQVDLADVREILEKKTTKYFGRWTQYQCLVLSEGIGHDHRRAIKFALVILAIIAKEGGIGLTEYGYKWSREWKRLSAGTTFGPIAS